MRHLINSAAAGTPVLRLLFIGCPHAIAWVISAIVVDALNCVSGGRWLPHVLVERLERVSPALAHSNSSATVVGIALDSWVVAASAYVNPRLPRFGFRSPMRPATDPVIASATGAWTALESERRSGPDNFIAAVAATFPENQRAIWCSLAARICDNNQSPDPLTKQVGAFFTAAANHKSRNQTIVANLFNYPAVAVAYAVLASLAA
jgi:hypothetical protein